MQQLHFTEEAGRYICGIRKNECIWITRTLNGKSVPSDVPPGTLYRQSDRHVNSANTSQADKSFSAWRPGQIPYAQAADCYCAISFIQAYSLSRHIDEFTAFSDEFLV